MPRLDYLEDKDLAADARELLKHAESAGSPDPRVLRIIFKSPMGVAWYRYWLSLSNEGELPKDLKELCRVKIAFDHTCGYCGLIMMHCKKICQKRRTTTLFLQIFSKLREKIPMQLSNTNMHFL